MDVLGLIRRRLEESADRVFLVDSIEGRRFTYAECDALAADLAVARQRLRGYATVSLRPIARSAIGLRHPTPLSRKLRWG